MDDDEIKMRCCPRCGKFYKLHDEKAWADGDEYDYPYLCWFCACFLDDPDGNKDPRGGE